MTEEDITSSLPPSLDETQPKFPPPIIKVSTEALDTFKIWLDEWIMTLQSDQANKQRDWVEQEEAYRAKPGPKAQRPFVGAANHTVPAIAMAVDPIHARLDTGIFKQDPVFQVKPLRKSFVKYSHALATWIEYYQRHRLKLRQVVSPRLLELTKLGTCVLKTVYDRQSAKIRTYDTASPEWKVIDKIETCYSGPRVYGVSIGDFLFPPLYQYLQDCPIVIERQRTSYSKLKVAEASGKLKDVDSIKDQTTLIRTPLEAVHEESSNHQQTVRYHDEIEVFEAWCDYDIDGDGLPEHLVATYHYDSHTLLQLRYNWYFNQRKPYTVIPYQLTNDSLYGIGICEMVQPLQEALTKWERMATDNTYLANIRMFVVKKDSGIEEIPRLYAGRCFFVDDPKNDFIPFAGGDIYPSTLSERQNLFGLIEKRTGVSDYLTGRESPIIGSRATATSTLALIQEGTKRVEEVLENIRNGLSEVMENCIYIWIQFGLDDIDDIVFGDDETARLVSEFFAKANAQNVNGALAIDLTATDAAGNKQSVQQMQLQIITIMMQYLEKLLAVGQAALQAEQQMPQFSAMCVDVMNAARQMFKDLLQKYDIRNPEDYLPDLEKYLNVGQSISSQQGGAGGPQGQAGGAARLPNLPLGTSANAAQIGAGPASIGNGGGNPAAQYTARTGGNTATGY